MNIAGVIEGHPSGAPAMISRGRITTYGELRRQVGELRGGLGRLGVVPGDRVGLISANNWFFVLGYLAVTGMGAVAVPLNPASPAAELGPQLAAVGARVVIAGPSGRTGIEGVDLAAAGVEHLIAPAKAGIAGAEALEDLFPGPAEPLVERSADDLAVLIFTSGTAGSPKPAMLTHGNLLSNLHQLQEHPERVLGPSDVTFGVLPLFHIFGLNVALGLSLLVGGCIVLVERFDPLSALETIANHEVTMIAGVPPMYTSWLASPDAPADAFKTVRLAVSGAAALTAGVADAFRDRFGIVVHEGYGLTEASPAVTSSVMDGPDKSGSIGVPLAGVELRLVDADGEDALTGDPGEIWVRGANVFPGYWHDPEATKIALSPEGWLRTGDVAVADDDGYLFIVDRAKDVIIVSGFNVFPAEVEDALREYPGVVEVAVVGTPHPHTGETVKAYVVAAEGHHIEEDELIEFCSTRLARYKCPTKVMFVDTLGYNAAGKVVRRNLR